MTLKKGPDDNVRAFFSFRLVLPFTVVINLKSVLPLTERYILVHKTPSLHLFLILFSSLPLATNKLELKHFVS